MSEEIIKALMAQYQKGVPLDNKYIWPIITMILERENLAWERDRAIEKYLGVLKRRGEKGE